MFRILAIWKSKHLKDRSVPPVGNGFGLTKGFCSIPVSGHFPYEKVKKQQNDKIP